VPGPFFLAAAWVVFLSAMGNQPRACVHGPAITDKCWEECWRNGIGAVLVEVLQPANMAKVVSVLGCAKSASWLRTQRSLLGGAAGVCLWAALSSSARLLSGPYGDPTKCSSSGRSL
jgi:hypothetical protein